MTPRTRDDVRPRLDALAQQNPEWRLWLTLVEETLRAAEGPAWIAAIPQPHSHRPPGAPLLAGVTLAVHTRWVSHWMRRIVKLATKDKEFSTASLAGLSFSRIDVLALLQAAICQDHTHIKALAEVVGADSRALGTIAQLAACRCSRCAAGTSSGPVQAMALDILNEWRLAQESLPLQDWLDQGAPSDDTQK